MAYLPNPNDTYAEKFVKLVREELDCIKRNFFSIGFRLAEANDEGYYYDLGYNNIVECAEDLFGFKKTTTYDLINVYKQCHDRQNRMCIDSKYEKFSQSQLVIFTGGIWAGDDFLRYARPEDTVETLKKAKSLWNKLYRKGSSPHSRGKFNTLTEFLKLYGEAPVALPASKKEKPDFSGQTENFIEVKAVDAEQQDEDTRALPTDFSGQTEKFGEFSKEAILHFIKIMDFSIGFGGDKKKPGTRVVPDFFTEEILKALARAIEKDRTRIKRIITNYIIDNVGKYPYEIKLYDRAQAFSIFAGVLAGHITDYLIKELKGEKK